MPPPAPDLEPDVRDLIRRKARLMCRSAGLDRQGRADVEQDLVLCYLRQRDRYDPERGPLRAFATVVLANCARNLLRHRRAARRDPRRLRPLGVAAAAALGGTAHAARLGRQPVPDLDQDLLAHDVAEALAGLPPDLRGLAEELMAHGPSEAARRRGVPRSTLYAQLRRLAAHFRAAGLGDSR